MGGRFRLFAALLVAALFAAAPAQAAWHRAETERFIVYGQGGEDQVREYADKLSTFDAVLRVFNPRARRTAGQKVEVYLVQGSAGMRRIRPDLEREVAGFYVANNESVFAVALVGRQDLNGDEVLFHEYAHHFMLENFPAAYPAWFVEGWAEYFQTVKITPKTITIGDYSPMRVEWLFGATWMPLDDLLTKRVSELKGDEPGVYYAQSWLLMHYMRSVPERAAQLDAATLAISKGENPVTALTAATGMTTRQLQQKLRAYYKIPLLRMDNKLVRPPVTVTRLPESADDFLLENLRLMTSAPGPGQEKFMAEMRKRAARHPGDRYARMSLARAEFTHGDIAAGEAIMTELLAASPDDVDALVLAGVGQFLAGYRNEAQKVERFRAARQHFIKAYKLNNADFRALYHYARSREVEAAYPNDNDLTALMEARALAPSVSEISIYAGAALFARGRRDEALRVLAPVVNSPHNSSGAAVAKALAEGKTLQEAEAALKSAATVQPAAKGEGAKPDAPPKPAAPPPDKAAQGA